MKNNYGLHENQSRGRVSLKRRGLAFVGILVLLALFYSVKTTQDLAETFGYDSNLGEPFIGQYYAPYKWLIWKNRYESNYPSQFERVIRRNLLITSLPFLALTFFALMLMRPKRDSHLDLHGSARFANFSDIKKMGILDNFGVAIGAFRQKSKKHYLWHDGPEHVLAFAPTRSGKGVGLVLPTLLSWPWSTVVYDIKKENWYATSAWRKDYANNAVLRFDPGFDGEGVARFNPLAEIRLNTNHDVADAQMIAEIIVNDGSAGGGDPHWRISATDFLVGVILHLCYLANQRQETATLPDVAAEISNPDRSIDELFNEMLNVEHTSKGTHPVVAQTARSIADKPDKERGSVISTAMGKLTLYRDPIVSKNVSGSDFKINDLMNSDKPVSLYICVIPKDQDRMKPLTRLMLTMIVQILAPEITFEAGRPKDVHKYRMCLMIDEFPSLGRLPSIEKSLAFLAGYGIKCYLIIQDFSQIRSHDAYGPNEAIVANCHVRIAYAPNSLSTADELSRMTGVTTITRKDVTTSIKGSSVLSSRDSSMSTREEKRFLMTPDEVQRLKSMVKEGKEVKEAGDMLIFVTGQSVIYGEQILYFQDPAFLARSILGAPASSDRIINGVVEAGDDNQDAFDAKIEALTAKENV